MNRFKKILFIVLAVEVFSSLLLIAQPLMPSLLSFADEKFVVDSIKISGNDITEDFIIQRELTFREGDSVTTSQLGYNRERIFSLNLFSKVEVYRVIQNSMSLVQIDVRESWYIYPIPFIRRADKSNNTYSYRMNFTYKNFRGRNENISATVSLGYDPYFSMYYENPVLFYYNDIGAAFGFSYLNSQNKSDLAKQLYGSDFKNRFYSAFVSFYKRLDQFNIISAGLSYDYVKIPNDKYFYGISASGKNIDRTLSLSIAYSYDSRDLKQFPQSGIYAGAVLVHKGFGINNINYDLFGLEYMQYEKVIGELSTRWRIASRNSFGRLVPYYDYSYLGYDESVRGHSFKKREGHNTIISSFEISYPIMKEFDFSIKLPLLPQSLTSARIGIFITAFADAGNAYNNNYRFRLSDFNAGYGIGITILALPYNALRIEYAFGDKGKGELLLGTGFAF